MKKKNLNGLLAGVGFLVGFVIWTLLVATVDVQPIGPCRSFVGFATLNGLVHDFFGVHMWLYNLTDWLGLVPVFVGFSFGLLGLVQWIKRRSILKVDKSIRTLGIFYLAVIFVYVLFEYVVINRRPVLINGYLEASYPSSTTVLVLCVMLTAVTQFKEKIKNKTLCNIVCLINYLFVGFMVIGRLVSGVHWFSDIVGGVLVSLGLVLLYRFCQPSSVERD